MSDVDDVIARHRARLEEAKRDLDSPYTEDEPAARAAMPPAGRDDHNSGVGFDDAADGVASQAHHHVAADPHGRTWADAGRKHRPSQQRSAAREYVPAPRVTGNTTAASPARSTTSSRYVEEYVVDSPTGVFERSTRWASQRDKAVQRQREEKSVLELEDCTFHPTAAGADTSGYMSPSSSRRRQSPRAGSKPATSMHVDSLSFHQHVQRQEGARRDREDVKRKVDVDIAKWEHRTTVPREFAFGKRAGPIAALRKPIFGGASLQTPRDGNSPRDHQRPHHHEEDADDIELSEDEVVRQHTRPSPTGQQPRTARQRSNGDGAASASPPQRSGSSSGGVDPAEVAQLTKDMSMMRATCDRQQDDIARLGGTVVSLKRELEAAKAKLRHYALGGN